MIRVYNSVFNRVICSFLDGIINYIEAKYKNEKKSGFTRI